jgi:hypothetical protein
MPIIPAMQEAEIRGSRFKASLNKKKVSETVSKNKPGVVVHNCNPSYSGSRGRRIIVQGWPWAKTKNST